MYRERLVIICDAPHPTKQADFDAFSRAHADMISRGQLRVLPTQSLEEYYPNPYRQTADQVGELGKHMGLKRDLARHVGSLITREAFEQEMQVLKTALDQCWARAYV
jgi:hypothetical protein